MIVTWRTVTSSTRRRERTSASVVEQNKMADDWVASTSHSQTRCRLCSQMVTRHVNETLLSTSPVISYAVENGDEFDVSVKWTHDSNNHQSVWSIEHMSNRKAVTQTWTWVGSPMGWDGLGWVWLGQARTTSYNSITQSKIYDTSFYDFNTVLYSKIEYVCNR